MNSSETIAGDRSNQFGLLTEHKFCRKLSMSISIDSRYCNRFINLGRPIFPLNHSGASPATVFTIPTTFGIAHARCYTPAERAAPSATRVGSWLLNSTWFYLLLRPQNCIYLQSDLLCLYKLNYNIFDHHERLYFSLHRPAPAIRHFFWLAVIAGDVRQRNPASWLRNDLSIPHAPENMSHYNLFPYLDVI